MDMWGIVATPARDMFFPCTKTKLLVVSMVKMGWSQGGQVMTGEYYHSGERGENVNRL